MKDGMAQTRTDYGFSRTVHYDAANHFSVICQLYGSVWTKVLPHCLLNVFVTVFLLYLLQVHHIDWTISAWGHEFMAVLVSFLVISKLTITLNLYFEFQSSLVQMNQAVRDVVQLACVFTEHHDKDSSRTLQDWRFDIAYHALLLQMTVATMLHKTNGLNAWETPGLIESERKRLKLCLDDAEQDNGNNTNLGLHSREWVHGFHLNSDLNLRVPIRMAHRLRSAITSHRALTQRTLQLDAIQEQQLLATVNDFMKAYHAIRKYLTTPLPFPLVQMARIFLFFYVYTLPFAILSSDLSLDSMHMVVLVFIMTYGFVGMELVCIELDDPFGDDPNDLPVVDEAKDVCDDVFLIIFDIDGLDSARKLKAQMSTTSYSKHNENGLSWPEHDMIVAREVDPLLP